MCLAFLRYDPTDEWPVLLASIRDEDLARRSVGPGFWWPETHPRLVGGRDEQAGGTWLALDPDRRKVAAVFTPAAPPTPAPDRRTRGELPLRALGATWTGGIEALELSAYEPFALLLADPGGVQWLSWDGELATETAVAPGLHVMNISGLDAVATSARQARWLPPFAAGVPDPFAPEGEPADRWGDWVGLLDEGLEPEREDALLLRGSQGGHSYGTKSAALIALSRHGVRYDASAAPWDASSWAAVPMPSPEPARRRR